MACSNCGIGLFSSLSWRENSSPVTLDNGVRVFFITQSGDNTGVKVIKQNTDGTTKEIVFYALGGEPFFAVWGSPQIYLAILIKGRTQAGENTRTVALIDTEDHDLRIQRPVIQTLKSGIPNPFIAICPGDGSVVFTGSPGRETNERVQLSINTSDGRTNFAAAGPVTHEGVIQAKAFAEFFAIVRGSSDDVIDSGARILGISNFTDDSGEDITKLDFDSCLVGETETQEFRIKNIGGNCFKVDSIVSAPPFTVSQTNLNRTLEPGESLSLSVTFAPTSNVYYSQYIEIRGPSDVLVNGDNRLNCTGNGILTLVEVSGNFNFNKVPVLSSRNHNIRLKNVSDSEITYTGAPSTTGSRFRWNGFSGTLAREQTSGNIRITFLAPEIEESYPPVIPSPFEQLHKQTFSFITNPFSDRHSFTLRAVACRAQPLIVLDPFVLAQGITFGRVPIGVKRIISLIVRNPGNSILHYSARIVPTVPGDMGSEMNALNFGMQLTEDSEESAVRTLSSLDAYPQSPCGSIDSGEGLSNLYAVVSGIIGGFPSAILEIFDHNVTNGTAFDVYRITLRAEILDVIIDE